MLVNVIYDHGKITFPDNIKLKNERLSLVMDIPDKDIRLQRESEIKIPAVKEITDLHPEVKKMMNRIDAILGSDYVYSPVLQTDKELFMEALEESGKYDI